ncbi:MAG: DNA-directed RNA polymerase subunit alpha [Nitrospirota bacterium]
MKIKKEGFQIPKKIIFDEETLTETYGKLYAEPFERGFGTTIGNSLRRVLLSSLEGAAITTIRIPGVLHEFSTIRGVKEDVTDIILNLKKIRFKLHTSKPKTINLKVKGPKEALASDIKTDADTEILTPNLHIATLDKDAKLEIEMVVGKGRGYVPAEGNKDSGQAVDMLPVDSIFSPVHKVNFTVENARVGHSTDYDRLIMEIWTDGSLNPEDAVSRGAEILKNHLSIFVTHEEENEEEEVYETTSEKGKFNENLLRSVDELELSVRSYNCFKNANIKTIADLVQKTEHEMLKTKNFGRKSLNEIKEILTAMGLSFGVKLDDETLDRIRQALK